MMKRCRICEGTRNKDGKDNLRYCSNYHSHLMKFLIYFYYSNCQTGIFLNRVLYVIGAVFKFPTLIQSVVNCLPFFLHFHWLVNFCLTRLPP